MLHIALAQINSTVGKLDDNCEKIIQFACDAKANGADMVVFSELSLCGYPPQDLLLKPSFIVACERLFNTLCSKLPTDLLVILGLPVSTERGLLNAAVAVYNGTIMAQYGKIHLPNFGVFDEKRYFIAGDAPCVFEALGVHFGLSICEDLWHQDTADALKAHGAECILNLNASPFELNKPTIRYQTMVKNGAGLPLIYVNQVGGQDELVFDGSSFALDTQSNMVLSLPFAKESIAQVIWADGQLSARKPNHIRPPTIKLSQSVDYAPVLSDTALAEIYQAIVLGIRDYAHKNYFQKALLGLSGGIDSALVLALAVEALGATQIEVLMMPSRFNLDMSLTDAKKQADKLGVVHRTVSIEPMFEAYLEGVEFLSKSNSGVEVENIQARIRGNILMARSNQTGAMLLTTGNKSEMAVGYATLYGDMAGGFAPIKDIYKTTVFALARWINRDDEIIPQRVINRPPSAELSFEQKDTDSLPEYEVLDEILYRFVEQNQSVDTIIATGLPKAWVKKITRLVKLNEYKRYQAPPGVKISQKAFGHERRYPLTDGFNS